MTNDFNKLANYRRAIKRRHMTIEVLKDFIAVLSLLGLLWTGLFLSAAFGG